MTSEKKGKTKLAVVLDGRYLNAEDTAFFTQIDTDIQEYIKDGCQGILLFPHLENYHRRLIHVTIEDYYPQLRSFSIGEGEDRRTAVCPSTLSAEGSSSMDHNVGMARKNFGGRGRTRPSPDRRGDRDGGWGGDKWEDKRNRSRNRWEHDDRGGSDYGPQNQESPVVGRRGRGRGRGGVAASPQPQKKGSRQNSPQYRRNSTEWGQYNKGQRPRRDSDGSGWGKGPYHQRGQGSPQVYRRGSDPWGDRQKNTEHHRSAMNINRNQAPGRNGPEGAEVDRSQRQKPTKVRRPDAQVYIPRARRQQMEGHEDTDSPPPMNVDNPPGQGYRPGHGRHNNPRPSKDVYVPRVKRVEQDSNMGMGHDHYGSMPGLRYPQHPQQDYQEQWKSDDAGKYNQKRRKSLDGNKSRAGSRSGSLDNRNRYNEGYNVDYQEYHEGNMEHKQQQQDLGRGVSDRIPEQTFYNRAMRAMTPDERFDSRSEYQGGYGGGRHNNNSNDRQDRTPSRNRRRRRSHSNSSRRSQPSPNRTGGPAPGRREGRRPSDTWSQDGTPMNRRASESWSQDEGYYMSGSNSLPRRHRRISGGYSNPEEAWAQGHYNTESWSPSHQMNEPWGPNESRTLGRIRRSSGNRGQDDHRGAAFPCAENWSPTQQPADLWNQNKPSQGRGRTRRKSGDHKGDYGDTNQGRRMQHSGSNWNQNIQSDNQSQPNRRWQQSPGPTKRRDRNQARSVTPSESWSSDAENWDSDTHSMGPSSGNHYTLPPCGNMIIEVTPGGRNVSDTNAAFSAMVGSPTHDPMLLEESVRAQASDVSDKVRSMCADLSDLKHSKEKLNAELQGGKSNNRRRYDSQKEQDFSSEKESSKSDPSSHHDMYDLNKRNYAMEVENSHVCDSASSSTSPSHGPNIQRLDPAFVPHPIDADDVSSDGQSSVQPESSTSVESPDMGEFHALSSAGEHEGSPQSCSPGPPEFTQQVPHQPSPLVMPESTKLGYVNDAFEDDLAVDEVQDDVQSKLNSEESEKCVTQVSESQQAVLPEPAAEEPAKVDEEQQSDKTDSDTLTLNVSTTDPGESVDALDKKNLEEVLESEPKQSIIEDIKEIEPLRESESCRQPLAEKTTAQISHEKDNLANAKSAEKMEEDVGGDSAPADAGEIHLNWADMVDDEDEKEESTWDRLFDETGEALDPKLLDELTIAVGKEVKVQKPKTDYYNYKPKEPEMNEREYAHLIEIYDFPKELLTRDLMVAFKDFHERGFDLKWVDDTHCIGVFANPIAAEAALGMRHPLLKVRPISQASRQTKVKAKRCAEFLEPYRPRQETTAAVARSLVTRALGIKTRVPREKREQERNKLKEAREKKNATQRQRKDAWEGNFPKSHTDQ